MQSRKDLQGVGGVRNQRGSELEPEQHELVGTLNDGLGLQQHLILYKNHTETVVPLHIIKHLSFFTRGKSRFSHLFHHLQNSCL